MADGGEILLERYANLVRAGGTNQLQRTPPGIEEGFINPDERDQARLIEYARAVASELRFHNVSGQPTGAWRGMFDPLLDADGAVTPASLAAWQPRADLDPQLVLLFAFLRAFENIQNDFNGLPSRHLSYFYKDVLGLKPKDAVADQVHVLFTLTKNAGPVRLEAGTLLNAGQDDLGQTLRYSLLREVIVNQASISQVARQVAQRDRQGRLRLFRADAMPEGGWPSFGADPYLSPDEMIETDPGFAIADPVLRLAEGARTIRVTAQLSSLAALPPAEILSAHVAIDLSGAEGWLTPETHSVDLVIAPSGPELQISATIGTGQPAIVDYDADLHAQPEAPAAPWPVLRCRVKSNSGRAELFSGLEIDHVDLTAEANGVTDLIVQNDQRTLAAGGPLQLFTARPKVGSNFYIGSNEIFGKRLDRLTLNFSWKDLPDLLLQHYYEYFDNHDSVLTDLFLPSFTMSVDLLDGRSWDQRLTTGLELFDPVGPHRSETFVEGAFTAAYGGDDYTAAPDMAEIERYGPSAKRGFLRLQLSGPVNEDLITFGLLYALEVPFNAFGHDAYAQRYAKAAIDLGTWDGTGVEPVLPNEPYTPEIENLSLDYSASSGFSPDDIQARGRVYTIGAFGYTTAGPDVPALLAPQMQAPATMQIGISDFDAPGTASILFNLDEGSAQIADPPEPGDISWSYLSGDHWIDLPPSAVIVEETRGFQVPGIAAIAIGADATRQHTAMPSGLTWLRANLAKPPLTVARTTAVHAQAATAVFAPEDGELEPFHDHLAKGLAPEAITRIEPRLGAIKKVEQPYPSFAGRSEETERAFFQRSVERIRHRGRAVTAWDFERLVLQNFDRVFKVRCLPNTNSDAQPANGQTALVIVPRLDASQASNPLEPRASETLMESIRDLVSDGLTTPYAEVHIIYPVYERILVDAEVSFRPGFDAGFYAEQLNTDIQRFLSPWAFEEGRDIAFGTRIFRSEILKYVEDRPYVDYVTRFDLYHAFDGPPRQGIGFMEIGVDFVVASDPEPAVETMTIGVDFIVGRPIETAESTRPEAILVSHPAHRITPILPGDEDCAGITQLGIGYMIVGLDFDVSVP